MNTRNTGRKGNPIIIDEGRIICKKMGEIMNRSRELRNDPEVHYNCAQGVFIPFAEKFGLTKEQAAAITANFGAGMKSGYTCGSITGGLMVLGLYGLDDPGHVKEFFKRMGEKHNNLVNCKDLLREEVKSPEEKKPHCDDMVYEAVEIAEDMIKRKGTNHG